MKARENDFRKKTWTIPSICTLLYFRYCWLDYPVNILVNTIWARRHRLPKRRPKPPKYVCMVLMFTTKLQGSHRRHWFHLFKFNTGPPPLTAQHIPNSPAPSKAHRIIPGFSPFPGPINNIGVKHESFATKVKRRWFWPQSEDGSESENKMGLTSGNARPLTRAKENPRGPTGAQESRRGWLVEFIH